MTIDKRARLAMALLGVKDRYERELVVDCVDELDMEIAQRRTWNTVPHSARDKANLEAFRTALVKLRTAGGKLSPQAWFDFLPSDLDERVRDVDRAIGSYSPSTDQGETFAKAQAADGARVLLNNLHRKATTTPGSDWCRLAAILHFGDGGRHRELRNACLAVLKRQKSAVV